MSSEHQCQCALHEAATALAGVQTVSARNETYFPISLKRRSIKKELVPWAVEYICTGCIEELEELLGSIPRNSGRVSYAVSNYTATSRCQCLHWNCQRSRRRKSPSLYEHVCKSGPTGLILGLNLILRLFTEPQIFNSIKQQLPTGKQLNLKRLAVCRAAR